MSQSFVSCNGRQDQMLTRLAYMAILRRTRLVEFRKNEKKKSVA